MELLGASWGDLGSILGSFWGHFGVILELLGGPERVGELIFSNFGKTIKFIVRSLQIEGWGEQIFTKNEL